MKLRKVLVLFIFFTLVAGTTQIYAPEILMTDITRVGKMTYGSAHGVSTTMGILMGMGHQQGSRLQG